MLIYNKNCIQTAQLPAFWQYCQSIQKLNHYQVYTETRPKKSLLKDKAITAAYNGIKQLN